MSTTETVVLLVTISISVYILFASAAGLVAILKGRDKTYRKKYEEFLRQKERVESRLEKARQSQKGLN